MSLRPVAGEWRPFVGAFAQQPTVESLLAVNNRYELSVYTTGGLDVLFAPKAQLVLEEAKAGVEAGRLLYWLQGHPSPTVKP